MTAKRSYLHELKVDTRERERKKGERPEEGEKGREGGREGGREREEIKRCISDIKVSSLPSSAIVSGGAASSVCPLRVIRVPIGFPFMMSRMVSPCLRPLAITTAVPSFTACTADSSYKLIKMSD